MNSVVLRIPQERTRRESNPDLFVRTEASSCLRPREPNLWRGCGELNSDLKVRSLAPSSVGPHPHIGSGREIQTLIVRGRSSAHSSVMLCRLFSRLPLGAGCRNRTCFVSLKRRVHIPICQSRKTLVGDAGIEPAWSRLRVECICHLCQSPLVHKKNGAGRKNRTFTARLSVACSTFELFLQSSGAPFGS